MKVPGKFPALEAFAATASVTSGLLRAIRDAESNKAQWLSSGLIDSDLYFGVVDLERFSNDHFDDNFDRIRAYHKRLVLKTERLRVSAEAA